jgi:hypothetical protein
MSVSLHRRECIFIFDSSFIREGGCQLVHIEGNVSV